MAELKRSNIYGNLNLRSMSYPELGEDGKPKKDKNGNIITKSVGPSFKTAATPKDKDNKVVSNAGAVTWVEDKTKGTGLITALQDELQDKLGRSEEINIGYYCGRKLQTATEKTNEAEIRKILARYSKITSTQIENYINGYTTLSALEKTINPNGNGAMFTAAEKTALKKPATSPWRADIEEIKDKDGKVIEEKAIIKARLIGDHIRIFGRFIYKGNYDLDGNIANKVILRLQLKGMKNKKIKKIWKACGTCAGFGSAASIFVTDVQDSTKQRSSQKVNNKWTFNGVSFEDCPNEAESRTQETDGSIWLDVILSSVATSVQKSDKFSFYINCPVTFENTEG